MILLPIAKVLRLRRSAFLSILGGTKWPRTRENAWSERKSTSK